MLNNFLLSYDTLAGNPSESQLLNHVQINRYITQYFQPFFGTYLLKSNESLLALSDSLRGFFEANRFLLVQLQGGSVTGQMPQEIWNWINYGFVPIPPPAPPAKPLNALTGLGIGIDSHAKK